jgi:hypothetical protein
LPEKLKKEISGGSIGNFAPILLFTPARKTGGIRTFYVHLFL